MANIFVQMRQSIGFLNAERRFCRDVAKKELIQEKVIALEEILDFAKEYITYTNHQTFSDVGDRLYYYLSEGNLNYQKVADRFKVSVKVVAGNVHYASKNLVSLIGIQINRIKDAEDIKVVRQALSEFGDIRKSVINPYDLPEFSEEALKSLYRGKKLKIGGIGIAKNSPPIIIP
ncbi:hypothetical protein [Cohnella sp. AR92]|uniref:hypothetical protein n=1 Tax=Cohnella sp. AR92 TaxID=648716 RepID=UPI000F8F4BF3|nr:hypothetical protein [Cohnella sp. AR92]RUS44613.1 hypothetical protein ELR57_22790 [Cohnella sp. AR92]